MKPMYSPKLNHINIIRVEDRGVLTNGDLFIAMEYIQGGDLQTRLKTGNNMGEIQALGSLIELANTLQFIHNQGIVSL